MILKQSKRNSISRRFYAKNDKETIATWRSDLNSILLVFNVRSVAPTRLSLIVPFQTELVINTHMTVSDIHRNSLRARSLSTPPDKADTHVVGGHRSAVLFPNRSIELSAVAYGNRSNRRSTTSSTAKLVLREMRDSADAIGPLKSVAGSLCFILEICEVRPSRIRCPQRLQVPSERRQISKRWNHWHPGSKRSLNRSAHLPLRVMSGGKKGEKDWNCKPILFKVES